MRNWLTREDLDPVNSKNYELFGQLPDGFRSRCDSLEILHPYGSLGGLDEFAFGANINWRTLDKIANSINLIGDERSKSSEIFVKCKEHLNNSKTIIFLGFGFDKENLARLGFFDQKDHYNFPWFSTKGMMAGEINDIISMLRVHTAVPPHIEKAILDSSGDELIRFLRSNSIDLD